MRRLFLLCLCFFVLFVLCPAGRVSAEEDASSVIAKVIEAHGGGLAIEATETVYARGRTTAIVQSDEGTYVRNFKRGRKLRVDVRYKRSSETRILNGYRGSRDGVEVTGGLYLPLLYQYKQLDLVYGLLKKDYDARLDESNEEEFEGPVLTLGDREGPPMKVYIDPERFLIVKVSGFFEIAGRTSDLTAEFENYRSVGGIMLPFRIINYASGKKIAETVIEEYRVNPEIRDELFDVRGR